MANTSQGIMSLGLRYAGFFLIIGLILVKSKEVSQEKYTIDSPADNGSKLEQLISGPHNNQTGARTNPTNPSEPAEENVAISEISKEEATGDDRLEPISVKVLHGESNALSISDMFDLQNRRIAPLLSENDINVYSVDFHWNKGLIFYAAGNKIYRAQILGKHALVGKQVIANVSSPMSLAVDWVNDRLFWMSTKYQTVEVTDLDGENRKLLIDNFKPFKYPNNIAVDPCENCLFFVSDFSVFKSSLNGSLVERVLLDHNKRGQTGRGVRCIALDRHRRQLYLTGENHPDPNTNLTSVYIARANYDGSRLEDLKEVENARKWSDIFAIDFFRNTLYLAQFDSNSISLSDSLWTVDLTTKKTAKQFVPKQKKSEIWTIRVYHPGVQSNKCPKV